MEGYQTFLPLATRLKGKDEADITPVILIDTREQTPLPITISNEPASLPTGAYTIKGLEDRFAFERTSIADLIGSLTTGLDRFSGV